MFRLMCSTPDFIIPMEGAGPKLRQGKRKENEVFAQGKERFAQWSWEGGGGERDTRKERKREKDWRAAITTINIQITGIRYLVRNKSKISAESAPSVHSKQCKLKKRRFGCAQDGR